MPGQKSSLHTKMLKQSVEKHKDKGRIYGLEWGDPDVSWAHGHVLEHYLLPNVKEGSKIVEVGPGGGRWTRYMAEAEVVYAVDPFKEILDEHAKNIKLDNVKRIQNDGSNFLGIDKESIDFVWIFGVFVHLDVEVIEKYLKNISEILKVNGTVVIQYSDKTKRAGFRRKGHSVNNPRIMRRMANDSGYFILSENTTIFNASSIIVLKKLEKNTKIPFIPTGDLPELPRNFYDILE